MTLGNLFPSLGLHFIIYISECSVVILWLSLSLLVFYRGSIRKNYSGQSFATYAHIHIHPAPCFLLEELCFSLLSCFHLHVCFHLNHRFMSLKLCKPLYLMILRSVILSIASGSLIWEVPMLLENSEKWANVRGHGLTKKFLNIPKALEEKHFLFLHLYLLLLS